MTLSQEIEPGALYTRRALLPFGKEKGLSTLSRTVLHPAFFCPTLPPSPASLSGLIFPRIKGGSCPLHLSPFTYRGTINHHHDQDAKKTSGHSGGLHLVPQERWGRSFLGAQGSDAILPQPAAQGRPCLLCHTCSHSSGERLEKRVFYFSLPLDRKSTRKNSARTLQIINN